MRTPIRDEVRNYIVRAFLGGDARGFSDETNLQDSGILDSFATLELVQAMEATFSVVLEGDRIQPGSFRTVESIARMIEDALSESPG